MKTSFKTLLLLFVLSLPVVVQAQFTFTTNSSAITITGYTGSSGVVTIPDTTNGYPVTSIETNAFYNSSRLTRVTVGTNVTSIGSSAFYSCVNLTNVTLPNSLTSIGSAAFAATKLSSVTIPSSVTNMPKSTFGNCTSLTAITVDALNPVFSSMDGVLFDEGQTTLILYPMRKASTSYTVPSSVTNIASVAFISCFILRSVTIPGSVTSIGSTAFSGCTNLTEITVDDLNSFYCSADGVLFDRGPTMLIQCPGGKAGAYTIPNGITSIGNNAFSSCALLTSVAIPNSVTSIASYVFDGCTKLTSVNIPNSVTNLGLGVFSKCSSLTSVAIPNSITSIERNVFYYCTQLASVTIASSVTNIAFSAFYHCSSLTGVFFQGNAPSVDSTAFQYDNGVTVYYLPGTTGWSTTFGGRPTAPWFLPNPLILNNGSGFGVETNGFGFVISWATNIPVVVEACTDLANPLWSPVGTNTLTNGSSYFSDPQWTNYTARCYRLRSP